MSPYLTPVFHQMKIAIDAIIEISKHLTDDELDLEVEKKRRTIRELLSHISVVCKADLLIMNEATQEEMKAFYDENTPHTLEEIREALTRNYNDLVEAYSTYSVDELHEMRTSYWGVSYSRYEWLLEILCHLYHHRSQLHTFVTLDEKD